MKTLGLIGNPVSQSRSPELFRNFFDSAGLKDWEYRLFPMKSLKELNGLIEGNRNLIGFNVTIPHKLAIIPYCTQLADEAAFIGAVNTVLIHRTAGGFELEGHNTDVSGFYRSLQQWNPPSGIQALVLGNGGSSKAVQVALKWMKIPCTVVSRFADNGDITWDDLSEQIIAGHELIVNTTPLGMAPETEMAPPIPYELLTSNHYCFDLIYKPEKTRFLQLAEQKGAFIRNGYNMLQLQAEKAWELYQQHATRL